MISSMDAFTRMQHRPNPTMNALRQSQELSCGHFPGIVIGSQRWIHLLWSCRYPSTVPADTTPVGSPVNAATRDK